MDVYKRGRNAHSHTMAKNAEMTDYRMATGFEAVMGYLHFKQDYERMGTLIYLGSGDKLGERSWDMKSLKSKGAIR